MRERDIRSRVCEPRPELVVAQRVSIRTLRPSTPSRRAASASRTPRRGSVPVRIIAAAVARSTPMRRTRSPCCARAASGHAAAAPPSSG